MVRHAPALARIVFCTLLSASCTPLAALVPPTVDQDPSLPQAQLTVAGHTRAVHLRTFGDPESPPLLVLHGSLADHRALLPFQSLAEDFYVVMWDQRGNGLSERISAEEYTWASVVDELDAVREITGAQGPVSLLGHSFGAMYAALYMSERPGEVSQAVLMEPAGLNGDIMAEIYPHIIHIELWGRALNAGFWRTETLSVRDHQTADHAAVALLLDGHQTAYHCDPDRPRPFPLWRPGAHVEYLRAQRMQLSGGWTELSASYDFAAGLDTDPTPVRIIAGSCSGLGPQMQSEHHLELFENADLVTIPNTGHRMFAEDFDQTLAAVEDFLDPDRSP